MALSAFYEHSEAGNLFSCGITFANRYTGVYLSHGNVADVLLIKCEMCLS